ncbi:nucleoside recognition domain-containing protein [Calditerrivibrio sp.]|uniref:nucleoside recognition domain-containing protein n=2 Tax=Calditerrivibrionaceae TaxID=2945021 RepID=UPI003D119620
MSYKMIIYTFPFYILVDILKQSGLLAKIGHLCSPIMQLIGLPGEAAIGIISGMTLNMYTAIAALVPLHLNTKEMTIAGLFLGLAHNLFIETAVLSRAGANGVLILSVRIIGALIAAGVLNLVWI